MCYGIVDLVIGMAQSQCRPLPFFHHRPLQHAHDSIRLLTVEQTSTPERVECTLRCHHLNGRLPAFAAISYTWASQKDDPPLLEDDSTALEAISYDVGNWHDDKTIRVRNSSQDEYAVFRVGHNCWHALDQLRRLSRHRVCWIDAVCINQSDPVERSSQVPLMDRIYSMADVVYVCIDVGIALRQLASFQPTDQKLSSSRRKLASEILQTISRHDYWNRLWVLQEMCMARSIILVSDAFCLHFDVLNGLGMRFMDALRGTGLLALLRYLRWGRQQTKAPVYELLSAFHMQKCKEPHDLVYGLYAMMPKKIRRKIHIDYGCTLESLFVAILPFFRSHWGDFQLWGLAVKVVERLFNARLVIPTIQRFVDAPDIDHIFWDQRFQFDIKAARLGCDCKRTGTLSSDGKHRRRLYLGKGPWNTVSPWNVLCDGEPLLPAANAGDRPRLAVWCLEERSGWQCTRHKRDELVSWVMDLSYLDLIRTILCAAKRESLEDVLMSSAYVFRADYSESEDIVKEIHDWKAKRSGSWVTEDDDSDGEEPAFSVVPELKQLA